MQGLGHDKRGEEKIECFWCVAGGYGKEQQRDEYTGRHEREDNHPRVVDMFDFAYGRIGCRGKETADESQKVRQPDIRTAGFSDEYNTDKTDNQCDNTESAQLFMKYEKGENRNKKR